MLAFDNIRVIDLTHVIAGPFCTYQLSVMGAEVIKIEQPESPDMVRSDGANLEGAKAGMGTMFCAQNANKLSVPIDLTSTAGRDILMRLLTEADVLVENYRPGAMAALGLDYETVRSVCPDIIYCSLSGFGQSGPLSNRTAFDNVIQAYSGLMAATGSAQTGPVKVGPPVLDYGTGIQAAFAISAALFHRSRTGEGQYIDVAMLDAALMLCSSNLMQVQETDCAPELPGNNSSGNAAYGCFDTADGLLMLGAYTGLQCCHLWQELGDPEHAEELKPLVAWQMVEHVEEDRKRIADILLTDTAANWERRLNEAKVPSARVRTLDETLKDPHVQLRQVLQRPVETSKTEPRYPAAAFQFDNNGPRLQREPPTFAQHTQEILSQLDYEEHEIQQFIRDGVVA